MARVYKLKRDASKEPALRIPYDKELNPQQLAVVEAPPGPMLVIAGAGSGKTRTLTYRVARLIELGVRPDRIALLTFTNRAAHEMVARVAQVLETEAKGIWGGTFHSIGRRILRDNAERIGYPREFSIIDREDAESLMKQCIAEVPTPKDVRFPRPGTLGVALSRSLNTGRTVEDVVLEKFPQFAELLEPMQEVLLRYGSRKFELGVMDFDDLLIHWKRLFEDHADVRARYADKFQHVLVDEYQDTNRLQAELVDMLAEKHHSVTVVGDDCQSIFSFRGAEFRNILKFPERYPECRTFKLEINYRSTPQILELANRSIDHNVEQFEKELVARQPPGPKPALVDCRNDDQQSMFVAQRILDLRDEGVPLDQVAVLYRAHWQSMELQLELQRRGIPFIVRSGQRFFEQRHIKDVIAFLRFVTNPRDELAFFRLARLADGIGTRTAARLYQAIDAEGSLDTGLRAPSTMGVLSSRSRPSWDSLSDVLLRLNQPSMQGNGGAAVDLVREEFYEGYAKRTFDSYDNRLRELETLSSFAEQRGTVAETLDSLALTASVSGVDVGRVDDEDEFVVLSTIHQAKGLEFNSVFVLWLAEDKFPSARSVRSGEGLEEERRLFYVATTRAQRELYLTWPMTAYERGQGLVVLRPSVFVRELRDGERTPYERWTLETE